MQKILIEKPETYLVGLMVRTSYDDELSLETSKIGPAAHQYFSNDLADKIPNRKQPEVTIAAYTDYETDESGPYTYFIGEEVESLDTVPEGLSKLVIPAQSYQKFTTESGVMPDVVMDAWQHIWELTDDELGGYRNYQADFEVYDQRADDPSNTVLDLYIGVSSD